MTHRLALLLAATWLALAPGTGRAAERLLVVPFQGLTRAKEARTLVTSALGEELRRKGYALVDGAQVESILWELRTRYLDSLTPGQVSLMLHRTGAEAAVLGTVLDYLPRPDPSIVLLLQVVDAEGIRWSRTMALRASEALGPLGEPLAKSPDDVVTLLLMRGLADFPRAGGAFPPLEPSAVATPPRLFRARELPGPRPRICVLPLANRTKVGRAGAMAEVALLDALARTPAVELVPPALMRAAIVTNGLRSIADLGPEAVEALSATVGTTLYLQGTILRYDPDVPEVELYLSLTDLKTGKVLWSGLHRRRGADYAGWFALGAVKDPAVLLARTAEELIAGFTAGARHRPTKPEER